MSYREDAAMWIAAFDDLVDPEDTPPDSEPEESGDDADVQ